VYQTRQTVQKIKQLFKRRIKLLIITPIFFGLLSIAALYLIDPVFESSITIQVNDEETIDPLTFYGITVNTEPEDRFEAFDKIVYSRTSIEKLVDSLELGYNTKSETEEKALIESVREDITTQLTSSDLYEITYQNSSAQKARDGVVFLANHLVETRLRLEQKRNRETVKFFENKIRELEDIVENQETPRRAEAPSQQASIDRDVLQTRLQNIDNQLMQLEWQIIRQEDRIKKLDNFLNSAAQDFSVKSLYSLSLDEVSVGQNLIGLLEKYEQMSQQFTENYPPLRSLQLQIVEAVRRTLPVIESNLSSLKIQQESLNQRRIRVINDMESAFVATQAKSNEQSDISIYQELYDEMKIKLEQARISHQIGDEITEKFSVTESPVVANEPVFPKRKVVIATGLILGIIFGGVFMVLAETLDTTIRSERDLELDKPVIAFLTDGKT